MGRSYEYEQFRRIDAAFRSVSSWLQYDANKGQRHSAVAEAPASSRDTGTIRIR